MTDRGPVSPDGGWWAGAYRPHTLSLDCWCQISRGCRMLDFLNGVLSAADVLRG